MMNKRTVTTIGTLVFLFCALVFLFSPLNAVASSLPVNDTGTQDNPIVAKMGDSGPVVREIKTMLGALRYLSFYGTPSTYYTRATAYAVYYFQRDNKLAMTGVVDLRTYNLLQSKYLAALGRPAPASGPAPSPSSDPAPSQPPVLAPVPSPVTVSGLTAEEQLMIELVNQERLKAGVAPLQVDMRLVESARLKSQDMIDNNYFSHTSPTWGQFYTIIRQKTGSDYGYLGENLAGAPSVQTAHSLLMNSEGHRRNILNPNYTHIGIGIIKGGTYGMMFTQHFGGVAR